MGDNSPQQPNRLKRQVGVVGATLLGLGSILGTGVFVSLSLGAAATGPAVVLAIGLAALVALCNGLSSAQLAASHPVSGGTYEYGYRWLTPWLGFSAGWLFVCAKTASAAAASLGLAGYLLQLLNVQSSSVSLAVAVGAVVAMTALVLCGVRRSNRVNAILVGITIAALALFVIAGLPRLFDEGVTRLEPFFVPAEGMSPLAGFLQACALMFVAYTGYGRIATLGEEIHEPRRNIPRAMLTSLGTAMVLYVSVAFVGVAALGSEQFASFVDQDAAPLTLAARELGRSSLSALVAGGAVVAMLGVLLNLVLGVSRVVLAMGRRGDLPNVFARLNQNATTPVPAVILTGFVILVMVLIGDLKTTWSFSAFTVLIYYALTNAAALRMSREERLYPRFVSWCGLLSCLSLAFWVDPTIWLTGLGLLLLGWIWFLIARRVKSSGQP